MNRLRSRPVRPTAAALGALAVAAVLFAIATLAVALAPTDVPGPVTGTVPDPREPVRCRLAEPREGLPRQEDGATARQAVPLTTRLLHDCPHEYDAGLVVLRGEIVGPPLVGADGGAWTQLDDGPAADPARSGPAPVAPNQSIGLYLPPREAAALGPDPGGRALRRGASITVEGMFHRVDPERGELMVVRARRVLDVSPPGALAAPSNPALVPVAGVSALLGVAGVLAAWRRR